MHEKSKMHDLPHKLSKTVHGLLWLENHPVTCGNGPYCQTVECWTWQTPEMPNAEQA